MVFTSHMKYKGPLLLQIFSKAGTEDSQVRSLPFLPPNSSLLFKISHLCWFKVKMAHMTALDCPELYPRAREKPRLYLGF